MKKFILMILVSSCFFTAKSIPLPVFTSFLEETVAEARQKILIVIRCVTFCYNSECFTTCDITIYAYKAKNAAKQVELTASNAYFVWEDDVLLLTLPPKDIEGLSSFEIAKDLQVKDKSGKIRYTAKAGTPIKQKGDALAIPLKKVKK